MILGGIPYYWDFLERSLSWAQNIDNMFFSKKAPLRREFNALYASLFRKPDDYIKVINALGTHTVSFQIFGCQDQLLQKLLARYAKKNYV